MSTHLDEPLPLNARLCAYGEDRDYFERHFYWIPRPVSRDVALRLLEAFLAGLAPAPGRPGEWRADGDGRWIAAVDHPGRGTRYAVGVSVGPYLFIVTEREEDAARRLASAVVDQLP